MNAFWSPLEQHIAAATGEPFAASRRESLGGGCISQAWRVEDGAREFFVKVNTAAGLAMFQAEAAGDGSRQWRPLARVFRIG